MLFSLLSANNDKTVDFPTPSSPKTPTTVKLVISRQGGTIFCSAVDGVVGLSTPLGIPGDPTLVLRSGVGDGARPALLSLVLTSNTNMASPFVSSLRTSMAINPDDTTISAPSNANTGKTAMMSLFSGLDLALTESGAVVSKSGGSSAAKELIASKNAEKQAEAALAASRDLKRQQQKQQQKKEEPMTALSQALGLFDQELEQHDSFVSRNQRRQKSNKKTRGNATTARGRRQRQEKYKHV
ncbi:hypothetical protein JM16_003310 [Phytophthora kernoviae]|uniref:Uncharacterized protein n=1 Tax=Phytophthora kernoviae TaxID=325452 RepID=A0A8T0M4K1_9STRA|nr:hypothetical protein JM16_003310 [Phytophthora kernoviae]